MKTAEFSPEAVAAATTDQAAAILRILRNANVTNINVVKAGFDLPEGYLGFRYDYDSGFAPAGSIYGGIAPNGDVST